MESAQLAGRRRLPALVLAAAMGAGLAAVAWLVAISAHAAPAKCFGKPATITRGGGDNAILGTSGNDVIIAGGGHDFVRALGGDDTICLGRGSDQAVAGSGADTVLGQRGSDRERGGGDGDLLIGATGSRANVNASGGGRDRLFGSDGADLIVGDSKARQGDATGGR